jgi:hypothetical protein
MRGLAAAFIAVLVPLRAAGAPAAAFGNAPYDAPPANTGRVKVTFDFSAAEQIVAALSAE